MDDPDTLRRVITLDEAPDGSDRVESVASRWNSCNLDELYRFAIAEAEKNIDWYRKKKEPKQRWSHSIRCAALLIAIIGGLCPLFSEQDNIDVSRFGYILLATGGGLLLFDKLFGLSSSWMRFMVAAQELEALLDVFRVDWAFENSKWTEPATISAGDTRFQLIRDFIINMHAIVGRETTEWKIEFQKGIVHFESLLRQHSEGAGVKNRR